VVLAGPRKHQGLAVERRRSYFGFDLDTEVEPIRSMIPEPLAAAARDVLTDALIAGETSHADQGRIKRALAVLDELWRRSGATLAAASPDTLRARIRAQLVEVRGWEDFLGTRIGLDPAELVDETARARLDALPAMVRLRGDAVRLDYELADGQGIARVRLREGQAKRLREGDLPPLDRPLRFAVVRGRHEPILADTVADLLGELRRAPRASRGGDEAHGPRHGPRGPRGPRGPGGRHRAGRRR